jgi:hypothetical protein
MGILGDRCSAENFEAAVVFDNDAEDRIDGIGGSETICVWHLESVGSLNSASTTLGFNDFKSDPIPARFAVREPATGLDLDFDREGDGDLGGEDGNDGEPDSRTLKVSA